MKSTVKDKTKNKVLRKLTEFVTMRFQLKDTQSYAAERKLKQSQIPKIGPHPVDKETISPKKRLSPTKLPLLASAQEPYEFKLKFLQKISQEHFLIGNEYQLDLIKVGGVMDNFVEVQHLWSLPCIEPILSLSVETKACLFVLSACKTIFAYKYTIKQDHETEPPKLMVQLAHQEQVQQVRFANSTGVYVLLQTCLEFYRISWVYDQAQMSKYFTYQYELGNSKCIFRVPPAIDGTLNIYFAENKTKQEEQATFGLWKQSFVIFPQADKPDMHRMVHIYDIDVNLRNKIVILNYTPEICLIQFQNQMLAFRDGFVLDAVSTNFHQQNCFIKYIANSRKLVHFLQNNIDFYRFSMDQTVRPERINLQCQDSIEFTSQRGKLFDILELNNGGYVFFYWLSSSLGPRPSLQYAFTVAQQIDVRAKVNEIYPSQDEMKDFSSQQLHDKCEVVRKMGLSTQQAYYQLWRRSSRESKMDYQILLSIGDFPIIEGEVQKKLKHNMSFQTVIRIYQQCLKILEARVFSEKCSTVDLEQYVSCHFVLKKFSMHRNILGQHEVASQLLEVKDKERELALRISQQPIVEKSSSKNGSDNDIVGTSTAHEVKIGIKEYLELKEMSIVSEFIEIISDYLNKPSKQLINKVQCLFRYFKLIYRIHYQNILEKIVHLCKGRILDILKVIPELLPFVNDELDSTGLWGKVSEEEIESNLFLSSLMTIDNRAVVEEFSLSVWFKRNLNVNHGVIAEDLPLQESSKYEDIFYLFLCRVYSLKLPIEQRRTIMGHLQINYPLMPSHLRGKLQLYIQLYELYREFDSEIKLLMFLRRGEAQLFKMHFQHEKQNKGGFILKDIKSLYEKHGLVKQIPKDMKSLAKYHDLDQEVLEEIQSIYQNQGQSWNDLKAISLLELKYKESQNKLSPLALQDIKEIYESQQVQKAKLFNDGMYQYFSSSQSSVSDLKCIFNKLNNESNDFHLLKSSENLYEVLISAIMQKLMIGSGSDTPIDEILVYIENIPFPIHNDNIMKNLAQIQQINYESDMLRKIRVNMTLAEIMKKGQEVIELMVEHQIKRHEVHKVHDYRSLKLYTYKILAEIQCRKSNIYGEEYNSYSLKKYLANIMVNCESIGLCRQLLKDKFLIGQFNINVELVQSLVILLYQWKLCEKNKDENDYYIVHEAYVRALIQLLTPDNTQRQFIQLSLQYAQLLTWQHRGGFKITYPLFPSFHYYPSLRDIEEVFNSFTQVELKSVQLQQLFDVMIRLKKLGEQHLQMEGIPIDYQNKVRLELYQIYITRLIQQKQVKMALDNIFILLKIPNQFPQYNIVFPILIIQKLFPEVLQNTVLLLNQVISNYFNYPQRLALVLKQLFQQKFTTDGLNKKLQQFIENQKGQPIYGQQNPIINEQSLLPDDQDITQNNELVQWILNRIQQINQVYRKSYQLHIVFRIMCQRPLVLAKWIWCKKSGINLKTLRSFLSYMSLDILFNPEETLMQAKRIFEILNYKYTHLNFFNQIIKFKEKIDFSSNNRGNVPHYDEKTSDMIKESIKMFDAKLEKLYAKQAQLTIKNKNIIQQIRRNTKQNYQRRKSEYIYEDKDDGYNNSNEELSLKGKKRQKVDAIFDRRLEGREAGAQYTNYIAPKQLDFIPHPNSHKKRKASQYYPEMMNFQQNFKRSKFSAHRSFHQSDNSEKYQGHEGIELSIPSAVRVVVHSPRPNQRVNRPNFSPTNIVRTDSIILPDEPDQMENNNEEVLSSESCQQPPMQFEDDNQQIEQIDRMAEELLNLQGQQSQKLSILNSIESGQTQLKHFLHLLLEDIYRNSKFERYPFNHRMQLIVKISHHFEGTFFDSSVIDFFSNLAKFKQINDLPFKVKAMFPISLLLNEHSQQTMFTYFKEKVQPYLTSINIHLVIFFIESCFSRPTAKDDLITDFALKKLKAAKPEEGGNDCKQIICGLMLSMKRGNERIKEEAQKLASKGKLRESNLLQDCLLESIKEFTI